jgi:hypothetical protein
MISQPELFAQPPVRSNFGRRPPKKKGPPSRVVLILVLLLIGAGGGIAVGKFFGSSSQPSEIPTMKAELPLKHKPDQPGGIDIPHQDVTVFQQLDGKESPPQGGVEHLLPPPEMPQQIAEAPATQPALTATSGGASVVPAVSPLAPVETEPAPATVPEAATPQPISQVAPEPQAQESPLSTATTVETPAVAVKPSLTTPSKDKKPAAKANAKQKPRIAASAKSAEQAPATNAGSLPAELFKTGTVPDKYKTANAAAPSSSKAKRRIQLASLPDKQAAEAELVRLQHKLSSQLGSARLYMMKATLSSGKTLYRVQTEALPEGEAEKLCAAMKAKKTSCALVRP